MSYISQVYEFHCGHKRYFQANLFAVFSRCEKKDRLFLSFAFFEATQKKTHVCISLFFYIILIDATDGTDGTDGMKRMHIFVWYFQF